MTRNEQRKYLPGYRGIVHDISESGGPLTQVNEIVDDFGAERLIEAIDQGLILFQAGDTLFVSAGDFRLYREMLDRLETGDDGGDDDDSNEDAEVLKAAG